MAFRLYVVPIIGTGTQHDPRRPKYFTDGTIPRAVWHESKADLHRWPVGHQAEQHHLRVGDVMRRLLLTACALVVLGVGVRAVSYIAFEQLTVAASSVGFTAAKILPNGAGSTIQANIASCRLEAAEIRFTIDGTTPTTTVGTLLEIGDYVVVTGYDSIVRFRAIRTGAVSGVLSCNYSSP